MRRELLELGVIRRVEITAGDHEDAIATHGVGQLADIGNNLFRARHVELSPGEHEVALDVHFPEDEITKTHSASSDWMLVTQSLNLWQRSLGLWPSSR